MPQGAEVDLVLDEATIRVWECLRDAGFPVPDDPRELLWADLQRAQDAGLDVRAMLA